LGFFAPECCIGSSPLRARSSKACRRVKYHVINELAIKQSSERPIVRVSLGWYHADLRKLPCNPYARSELPPEQWTPVMTEMPTRVRWSIAVEIWGHRPSLGALVVRVIQFLD